MPLYDFYCHKCNTTEEFITNPTKTIIHSCGSVMRRLFSTPRIIMRPTGSGMALDSLNSKDTRHMKPEYIQKAAKGLEEPVKTIF